MIESYVFVDMTLLYCIKYNEELFITYAGPKTDLRSA